MGLYVSVRVHVAFDRISAFGGSVSWSSKPAWTSCFNVFSHCFFLVVLRRIHCASANEVGNVWRRKPQEFFQRSFPQYQAWKSVSRIFEAFSIWPGNAFQKSTVSWFKHFHQFIPVDVTSFWQGATVYFFPNRGRNKFQLLSLIGQQLAASGRLTDSSLITHCLRGQHEVGRAYLWLVCCDGEPLHWINKWKIRHAKLSSIISRYWMKYGKDLSVG